MNKYDKRNADDLKIPYAFQQKAVLRFLRKRLTGKERCSALVVYNTITWIVSDFSNENSKNTPHNWPSMISTYSGIGKGTASKLMKQFTAWGIINYKHERNPVSGKWHNWVVELPARLPQEVLGLAVVEPVGGLTTTGEAETL